MTIDGHEITKTTRDRALDLIRWYLKYHEATGCQIAGCVDGGFPVIASDGYWDAEQCEYCAMVAESTKLIEEIDAALPCGRVSTRNARALCYRARGHDDAHGYKEWDAGDTFHWEEEIDG